jgi:hypothetical protein
LATIITGDGINSSNRIPINRRIRDEGSGGRMFQSQDNDTVSFSIVAAGDCSGETVLGGYSGGAGSTSSSTCEGKIVFILVMSMRITAGEGWTNGLFEKGGGRFISISRGADHDKIDAKFEEGTNTWGVQKFIKLGEIDCCGGSIKRDYELLLHDIFRDGVLQKGSKEELEAYGVGYNVIDYGKVNIDIEVENCGSIIKKELDVEILDPGPGPSWKEVDFE